MDNYIRNNTEELVLQIQNLQGISQLHFPVTDFMFSTTGKEFFTNYTTSHTGIVNFKNLYDNFCNMRENKGKTILQAIFAEYAIVNIIEEIKEFYSNSIEHQIFKEVDSYTILNMIRNALSHALTWTFNSRTKNRLSIPIEFKSVIYDLSLDGQSLDLKYFSYKILNDLIDDLCDQLPGYSNK